MATSLETWRKVCGLLGSDSQGERAAAALKATAILREWGKTWADVTVAVPAEPRAIYSGNPAGRGWKARAEPEGTYGFSPPPGAQPFTYRHGRPQEDPAEALRKAKAQMNEWFKAKAEAVREEARQTKPNGFTPQQPIPNMDEEQLRQQVAMYLYMGLRGEIKIDSFAIKMLREALAETHWIPVLREAVFDTLTKLWIKSARAAA